MNQSSPNYQGCSLSTESTVRRPWHTPYVPVRSSGEDSSAILSKQEHRLGCQNDMLFPTEDVVLFGDFNAFNSYHTYRQQKVRTHHKQQVLSFLTTSRHRRSLSVKRAELCHNSSKDHQCMAVADRSLGPVPPIQIIGTPFETRPE